MQTHKRFESNLWTIPKTEFKFWKVKWVGPGPAHNWEVSRPRADPVWNVEKFLQSGNFVFLKKYFFFSFYERESFFDGKYRYLLHLTSKSQRKTCIPTSVAAVFSRFCKFQIDCNLISYWVSGPNVLFWNRFGAKTLSTIIKM